MAESMDGVEEGGSEVTALREATQWSFQLPLPDGVSGAESLAFDRRGQGPYAGVSDGRVLKWGGSAIGWTTFAHSANYRKIPLCTAHAVPSEQTESICGRPLGLQFSSRTGDLYIADAYLGLQAEKAAERMEAEQFRRVAGERIQHDEDTLAFLKAVVFHQEMEISSLNRRLLAVHAGGTAGARRSGARDGCAPRAEVGTRSLTRHG